MNTDVHNDTTTVPRCGPINSGLRIPPTRNGISVSLTCEFERYNPGRLPAWRWQLAEKLVATTECSGIDHTDEHLAHAVEFQQRLQSYRTPDRLERLRTPDADVVAAHELYQSGGWRRTLVEARLLAAVPVAEIARRCRLTERAVVIFAKVFYDVTERLQARDYVLRIVGTPSRAKSDLEFNEQSLKTFGYFMGPLVIEAMLAHVFNEHGYERRQAVDLRTHEGRLSAVMRLAIDARRPGNGSLRYAAETLRTLQRIREFTKAAERTPSCMGNKIGDLSMAATDLRAKVDGALASLLEAAATNEPSSARAASSAKDGEDGAGNFTSRIAI